MRAPKFSPKLWGAFYEWPTPRNAGHINKKTSPEPTAPQKERTVQKPFLRKAGTGLAQKRAAPCGIPPAPDGDGKDDFPETG